MQLGKLKELRNKFFDFNLTYYLTETSTITMYREVYKKLRKVLNLEELKEELKSKVYELDEYMRTLMLEKEQELARKTTIQMNLLNKKLIPIIITFSLMGMAFLSKLPIELNLYLLAISIIACIIYIIFSG